MANVSDESNDFYEDLINEEALKSSTNIKITANDIKEKIYTDLGITDALGEEVIEEVYKEEVISLESATGIKPEEKSFSIGALFNQAYDKIKADKENPEDTEEEYEEVEETDKPSIPTKPKVDKEESKELPKGKTYNFSEEELRLARIGLLKKSGVVKHWTFQGVLDVTLQSLSDTKVKALNNYYNSEILNKGERRTVVKYIDPYTDPETNSTMPGGRIEEDIYINPDSGRLSSRSTLAALVESIDHKTMPPITNENGEAALKRRVEILEEYNSIFLDKLYNEIAVPFLKLVEEASNKLLNF